MIESLETMLAREKKAREEKDRKNSELFVRLQASLQVAEIKHPVFAYSFKEGVMKVVEELGEVASAYNKSQGEARVVEELLDTLCVVWRLARGDWKESDHG